MHEDVKELFDDKLNHDLDPPLSLRLAIGLPALKISFDNDFLPLPSLVFSTRLPALKTSWVVLYLKTTVDRFMRGRLAEVRISCINYLTVY